MTNATTSTLRPFERRHKASKQQYSDHLPATERLQVKLRNDAESIAAEEGWDPVTHQGVATWIEDKTCLFRFLKRSGYDEKKAYNMLNTALQNRASHKLHQPLPSIPPYSSAPLFYVLPLPRFTDRLGRPIVVLTAKAVKRDAQGSMADLAQWIWWGAEMLRRTLRDHWVHGRWNEGKGKGQGGEGCVLIIDAGGSGYRNLEVELVPTFNLIGSKNFPGMIESAFVLNCGWVQRSLWSILRPILPRPAVERISLYDKKDMGEVFDLDRLPIAFGGRDPWKFSPEDNVILSYYQTHALEPETSQLSPSSEELQSPPQSGSFSSTAEVFYTANNTPVSSRNPSRRSSRVIRSERPHFAVTRANEDQVVEPIYLESIEPNQTLSIPSVPSTSSFVSTHSTTTSRQSSTRNISALERIRSLADFKLYLSPSRLAQVEALSDDISHDEVPSPLESPPLHRSLRPAIFNDLEPSTEAKSPFLRPPLRSIGLPRHLAGAGGARTYSEDLMRHHAKGLARLDSDAVIARTRSAILQGESSSDPIAPVEAPSTASSSSTSTPPSTLALPAQSISAFSRSSNPYYGYPAIRIADSSHPGQSAIIPRYPRRRKRDLIRILLFLFLLRLQSWRDSLERSLGLNRLVPWARPPGTTEATNPSEGLMREAEAQRSTLGKRHGRDGEWIWMGILFMLARGTWTRLLALPFEALGLGSIQYILGIT